MILRTFINKLSMYNYGNNQDLEMPDYFTNGIIGFLEENEKEIELSGIEITTDKELKDLSEKDLMKLFQDEMDGNLRDWFCDVTDDLDPEEGGDYDDEVYFTINGNVFKAVVFVEMEWFSEYSSRCWGVTGATLKSVSEIKYRTEKTTKYFLK